MKDSHDSEMATILVGKLYPSNAIVSTICDAKGTEDEKAVERLTQFIKESGHAQVVYKSDQERAITKMIEAAIRGAGRAGAPESGEAFSSGLTQAVAEFSAIGESASNGRAERAVQAVEDLLRTLKSALEARIKARIPVDHAVMRWLVEHVSTILNRYSVNEDGKTPCFAFHGKRAADKLVEFGEKVFYYVPRKARAKLDHRWRLGTFVGLSTNSNEALIGIANGNIVKSRSVARVVQASRWDKDAVLAIKGIPGFLTPSGPEIIDARIEESTSPHTEGDAEAREQAESALPAEATASDERKARGPFTVKKITNRDLYNHGYTSGCRRCDDLMNGAVNPYRHHTDECRLRIYLSWRDSGDPKYESVRHIIEPETSPPAPVPVDMDMEQMPPPTPEDSVGQAPETPVAPRPPPTSTSSGAQIPASFGHAPFGRWAPEQMREEWIDEDGPDDSVPPDMDDDPWRDYGPYDLEEDEDMATEAMVDALVTAGTDPQAALVFANSVSKKPLPASFIEVYGRGEIMRNANGPRRSLNIQGLGALDLRTFKPNGEAWDFEKRSDRNEARRLIDELQPTWIIGSPPCTAFSVWNRHMNYPKMDKERVRLLIEQGRRHLAFMVSLYKTQLLRGAHFLHEHPASALSWSEPGIAALARHPLIHCVVAGQCQYGLVTPSEKDKSIMMPALKPTKFMTSSAQMAKVLSKRCPKLHEHQQLVGGRAAQAAFYPLGLILAILQGIRNTALAEGAAINVREHDEAKVCSMASSRRGADYKPSKIAPDSQVKMVTGGTLPVGYHSDNFKPQYLDEYTGEVLPRDLIHEAIIDELNYFNDRVWQITTKEEMLKLKEYVFVRSRWIMSNAAEPDCRARLVACEVNKTGEKNDLFYASTPPLEAKKAMFARYVEHARAGPLPLRLSFVDVRKAYFNGVPKRAVFMQLPKELGLPSHYVAKQVRCVYGTRDAGSIWEDVYRAALEDMGFESGVASPCCFVHRARGLSVVVHGDDFTALGTDPELDWYESQLAQHFELKIRGRLGEGCPGDNELRILNRIVRITPDGLTYEADPRHVDLLSQSMSLEGANSVVTPGIKDPEPSYDASKNDDMPPSENLGAQADEEFMFSIKAGEKLIAALSKKIGYKVSFSDSAPKTYPVVPYSEIYGEHPSRLKARPDRLVPSEPHTDPYTGKNGAVMAARIKLLGTPERCRSLAKAKLYRAQIISRQPLPWADSQSSDPLDHRAIATLRRIMAVKSKSKFAGPKRRGAKAVKKMERAANADFLLNRKESTLFRALAARANFSPRTGQTSTSAQRSCVGKLAPPTKNPSSASNAWFATSWVCLDSSTNLNSRRPASHPPNTLTCMLIQISLGAEKQGAAPVEVWH